LEAREALRIANLPVDILGRIQERLASVVRDALVRQPGQDAHVSSTGART
jgi:hypothetical protein